MDSVLAVAGNVLRDLGNEIKRIKHLKIPINSEFESVVAGFGISTAFGMFHLVDDVVRVGEFHDPVEAERTSGDILCQSLP